VHNIREQKKKNQQIKEKTPKRQGGCASCFKLKCMYTIDKKRKKNSQQIRGKAPKRQGGHASCPKPKNMYTI
jgi:hypothetical protein